MFGTFIAILLLGVVVGVVLGLWLGSLAEQDAEDDALADAERIENELARRRSRMEEPGIDRTRFEEYGRQLKGGA